MKKTKLIIAGFIGICSIIVGLNVNAATSAKRNNNRVSMVTNGTSARGISVGRLNTTTLVSSSNSSSSSDLYELGTCSKKYMNCLKKSDVCGSDFSKCHSKLTFEAQKTYCADVLNSCVSSARSSPKLNPTFNANGEVTGDGPIDLAIKDGLRASSESAVEDCLDEVDSCITSACEEYPAYCDATKRVETYKKGDNKGMPAVTDAYLAENIANGAFDFKKLGNSGSKNGTKVSANSDTIVQEYLKIKCERTIGMNESCRILAGNDPLVSTKTTRSIDDDEISEIYSSIYGLYSKQIMNTAKTISGNFQTEMANKCYDAMATCVQDSCMGGSLAACYANARTNTNDIDLLNSNVSKSIENGCKNVINSNGYCNYAYGVEATSSDNLFNYLWKNNNTGYVTALNGLLSSSYSEGQLRNLKLSCQNAVESCVDDVCGPDYSGCFVSNSKKNNENGLGNGGQTSGTIYGFLDEEIVKGMCLTTVKSNQDCADTYFANWQGSGTESTAGTGRWGSPTSKIATSWKDASGTKSDDTIFNELLADYETKIIASMKKNMNELRNACISNGDGYKWGRKEDVNNRSSYSATQKTNSSNSVKAEDTANLLNNTCWIRVDVISDDTKLIKGNTNRREETDGKSATFDSRWFQAGDAITCGEWNSNEIKKRTLKAYQSDRGWATAASVLAGSGLGIGLAEGVLNDKMGIKTFDKKNEKKFAELYEEFIKAGGESCAGVTTTTTTNSECNNYTLTKGGIGKGASGETCYAGCLNGYTPAKAINLKTQMNALGMSVNDGDISNNLRGDDGNLTEEGKKEVAKRVLSDIGFSAAGATILGLTVNKSMAAAEIKKGYESVHCYIGGTKVADYGETFQLEKQ